MGEITIECAFAGHWMSGALSESYRYQPYEPRGKEAAHQFCGFFRRV